MKLDKENKTITLRLSDSSMKLVEKCSLNLEQEFNAFIKYLEYRDKTVKDFKDSATVKNASSFRSTPESYLYIWANKPTVICHQIIKAYLKVSKKKEIVYKDDIEKEFSKTNNNPGQTISRFTSNFRLMCSDAPKAYGRIFLYNKETSEVTINSAYAEIVNKLKDKYIN